MSEFKLINIPSFSDERGRLFVIEKLLPFEIKRCFWILGADNNLRGGHRHQLTHQALIAINGVVTVEMFDRSHNQSIVLDTPDKCLIVEPEDWHTMEFGANAILLVFSSEHYNRDDYIYEAYKR